MHVSITPTLMQWALAFNTTIRRLITDPVRGHILSWTFARA
jgi:hypothetical protein